MKIISESSSLSKLQIDLESFITPLQNLVFFGLGIVFSFNFSSSLSLHSSFLISCELLGKFLMLHHMPSLSR